MMQKHSYKKHDWQRCRSHNIYKNMEIFKNDNIKSCNIKSFQNNCIGPGPMNGLDPGPCGSKWVMHVTEEGEGPSQRFGPP